MDEVRDMGNIIKTEFLKLKRYSVIKAGIIMTVLSPLLSLFYSTANSGQTWTFDYFMQQVMINNCTLFFPIIIALIAGYIITREYTDNTMKNISTIPIPYKGLSKLPVKQRQRIYAHFFLGMSKADIAKAEGTHKSRITRSIEAGLRSLEKYFKEIL